MIFYNSNGEPIAYSEDLDTIYLFSGEPVAYFYSGAIYSFKGHHLGWYENGWVRDHYGRCVFFTGDATGSGPVQPVKHVLPVKGVKRVKPVKCVRQIARIKAVKSLSWSQLSNKNFLFQ